MGFVNKHFYSDIRDIYLYKKELVIYRSCVLKKNTKKELKKRRQN